MDGRENFNTWAVYTFAANQSQEIYNEAYMIAAKAIDHDPDDPDTDELRDYLTAQIAESGTEKLDGYTPGDPVIPDVQWDEVAKSLASE